MDTNLTPIPIGDLPRVEQLDDDSLLVLQQGEETMNMTAAQLREFSKGDKGDPGENGAAGPQGPAGKDATINGENAIELVEGENVTITQDGDKVTISATGGEGVSFTTDDTLTMGEGNVLGVSNPVIGIMSKEAFDALPPEKQGNGLYVVKDASSDDSSQEENTQVINVFSSNINILDNWYFISATNQYGSSSYNTTTRSGGYTIDRWKLTSGTLTVSSNGITLNGTLSQILETALPSGSYVATVLASDGPVDATYNNSSRTFTITASNKRLIAAKLEIGDKQTLYREENGSYILNDPPPNTQEMLARCQRYYVRYNAAVVYGRKEYAKGHSYEAQLIIRFYTPVPLYKNPSISGSVAWVRGAGATSDSTYRLTLNSNADSIAHNMVALRSTVTQNVSLLEDNAIYAIDINNFEINSNL